MLIKEFMILCDRALHIIPQCIYRVALLDVFRLPLYKELNIGNLIMTVTVGSKVEDIVRLAAFAANVNNDIRGGQEEFNEVRTRRSKGGQKRYIQ